MFCTNSINESALYNEFIVQPLTKIFSCNMQALHPVYLLNSFWLRSTSYPMKRFVNCLKSINPCWTDVMGKTCPLSVHQHPQLLHDCYLAIYTNLQAPPPSWNQSTWDNIIQPDLRKFKECYDRKVNDFQEHRCAKLLEEDCLTMTPVIAMKEIRLDFRLVAPLLKYHPDLRIIHLVRDPRGVMASSNWPNTVKATCSRLISDIKAYQLTLQKYPGCCIQIRYEDLASYPEATARRIYDHVGVNAEVYLGDWLMKINNPDHNSGSMGTYRSNMTAEAYDWKIKLSPAIMKYVMRIPDCITVIKLLNYDEG